MTQPLEKSSSDLHVEVYDDEKSKNIEGQSLPEFDQNEAHRILRKIDFRLLPVLTALYLMSFLDRSNSLSPIPIPTKPILDTPHHSRQRQRRRPFRRSRPLVQAIQHLPHYLLLPLRPLRSPLEHRPQMAPTHGLATDHCALLGNRHDAHGDCPGVWLIVGCEVLFGCYRGRFVPSCKLYAHDMVLSP